MKISVIVPVYNVEKYLKKCLDSLINQTLKEIEIIVVNDGSPDNSWKIISEYSKKYKNIRVINKENGGLSDARNEGLKVATGEYIAFVDSDDYVNEKMFEEMYKKAKEKDYDIVTCNLNYVNEEDKIIMECSSNIKNNIQQKQIKKCMLNIYPAAWNKIYKRKLFENNIYFKKNIWYEDVEFLYRLFPYIKSIGTVKKPLYNYVQREGAITRTFDKRLYNYIDNWNGIIDYYKQNNLYNEYKKELEYCYIRYIYATFIKQATNYKDKKEYEKAVETAIKNVNKQFPKYRKNKYFYKNIKGLYLIIFNKKISKILYKLYNK